ncbi:hypothetical protein E3N88_18163 [Mikania micrantha]|uniref:Uncharacterized protein n=1 Tax=Mikania micrantha TaxID=192012 RepID=A0A5N6NX10_9ASTR|nr:hypothetical protein E3N88_18163 [Mikania micrantha]
MELNGRNMKLHSIGSSGKMIVASKLLGRRSEGDVGAVDEEGLFWGGGGVMVDGSLERLFEGLGCWEMVDSSWKKRRVVSGQIGQSSVGVENDGDKVVEVVGVE